MSILQPQLAALMLLTAMPAPAQTARRFGIEVDNDFFVTFNPYRATDHEYTHGTRIWAESPRFNLLPRLIPGIIPCTETFACRHRVTIGQEIYTPRHEATVPIEGERPHAAWLYASIETSRMHENAATAVRTGLGVLGPPALGEEVQTLVHRWLDFRAPQGWDHQLPFEPTVQVGITRVAQWLNTRGDVVNATAGYDVTADVGNVLTQGHGAILTMVCIGSMTCSLTLPQAGARYGLSARARAGSRLVVRNSFLDGTLRESRSVRKENWVPTATVSLAIYLRRFVVQYERSWRRREYHSEPGDFSFASIRLQYAW